LLGAAAIRRATPADAEAVADCHTACWREAYAGLVNDDYLYSVVVERRRLARWRERLGGSRAVWLATDDTLVVGVASADAPGPTAPVPVQLMSLYVRAAYQGTGLADQLLLAAVVGGRRSSGSSPRTRGPAASTSVTGSSRTGPRWSTRTPVSPEIRMLRPDTVNDPAR
jgi:GNAT superfamily N-acetyltransferase